MRYSEQTIRDCQLLPVKGTDSVFDKFNFTNTSGGAEVLRALIVEKKESPAAIIEMHTAIRYLADHPEVAVQLNNAEIEYIRQYFRLNTDTHFNSGKVTAIFYRLSSDATFQLLRSNVIRLTIFLQNIAKKLAAVQRMDLPGLLQTHWTTVSMVMDMELIKQIVSSTADNLSSSQILKTDHYFRNNFTESFTVLLDALFNLEALRAVAYATKKHRLVFPEFSASALLSIDGAYHLLLKNAVGTDVKNDSTKNVIFLSGPNMAGKSTCLRSIATIVCLAHAGFPVPADRAMIPFYDEISAWISGKDDLLQGYSQFYNEIIQVRDVCTRLKAGKRTFAIFDEIFSGTNIRDARSCCDILMRRLNNYPGSHIILSSHNLELPGEPEHAHVQYNHIEVLFENNKPRFTYQIKPGKNEVSLGLLLFRDLGI